MGPAEYLPAGCFREFAVKAILEGVDVSKKIIREEKLISVAHPDFRAELPADAAARYHV